MKQAVQVTILGQQFTVKSSNPAEQVERVAAYVNRQLALTAASAPTADTLHVTVLTLLNIAGAYLQLQDQGGDPRLRERLETLLGRLDAGLAGQE